MAVKLAPCFSARNLVSVFHGGEARNLKLSVSTSRFTSVQEPIH